MKRERTSQAFDEFMQSADRAWVADLTGNHGIGKTTVFLHFYRSHGKIAHAWIDLQKIRYKALPLGKNDPPTTRSVILDSHQAQKLVRAQRTDSLARRIVALGLVDRGAG